MSEHSLLQKCWQTDLSFSEALDHIRIRMQPDLAARLPSWGHDEAIFVCEENLFWVMPGDGAAQLKGKEIMSQDWELWILN